MRLSKAATPTWVVYAKKPLTGPEQVVRYLARYTHRIAISNSRLVSYDGSAVTFLWRDRADGNRRKRLCLSGSDFSRRFLWHVLPQRLVRIRHYGLLSNRTREKDLEQCRALLGQGRTAGPAANKGAEDWVASFERVFGSDPLRCPACGEGRLTLRLPLPPSGQEQPQQPAPRSPP